MLSDTRKHCAVGSMLLAMVAVVGVSPAAASWILVDDFQTYETGTYDSLGHWASSHETGGIAIVNVPTPDDPDNQAIRKQAGGHGTIYNTHPIFQIPQSPTPITLTFRIWSDSIGPADANIGLHTLADLAGNQRPIAAIKARAGIEKGDDSQGDFTQAHPLESGTWYWIWMVITNDDGTANDTMDVYIQGGTGDYAEQTQLASGLTFSADGGFNVFGQRNHVSAGPTYDMLGIDLTGQNLTIIPEPATALLAGLGGAAMLFRRRRN